jgi:cell division protein FtsA
MFDPSNVVVGLEVGTSKVCTVVGEISENGPPNIIGVGQCRSRGVRKGEIVDVGQAEEDIRMALSQAEEMADVVIREVFLGVSGGHIGGFNNHGSHQVPTVDRGITEDDVEHVIQNARVASLGADRYAIHVNRHHFTVNDQQDIIDPVGMVAQSLEVDVHITFGNFNRLQNPIRLVKGLQLDVEGIVFDGLASSLAVLTPQQKQQGALVIDMGGGTTDYALFQEGLIRHTGVLAVGGDHLTNDLACFLKVPLADAERLKVEEGGAFVDEKVKDRSVTLPGEHGVSGKTVNLEHLRRIMAERLDEIFRLIEEELTDKGLMSYLRSAVVLCGGCANIAGLTRFAENIFQVPACVGRATSMCGAKESLNQPEFATGIGLVRFGAMQSRRKKSGGFLGARLFQKGVRDAVGQIFKRP